MWGGKRFTSQPDSGIFNRWIRPIFCLIFTCTASTHQAALINDNLRVTGAVETLSIGEIQGEGRASPYVGRQVRTVGVVTADLDESKQQGFFIQTNSCDHSDLTSDAVFMYLDRIFSITWGESEVAQTLPILHNSG